MRTIRLNMTPEFAFSRRLHELRKLIHQLRLNIDRGGTVSIWIRPELSHRLRRGLDGNGVRCERGPFPSVFKEGWLRLNKKILFLSGADGVVSNFKQIRCAARACKEATRPFTNH